MWFTSSLIIQNRYIFRDIIICRVWNSDWLQVHFFTIKWIPCLYSDWSDISSSKNSHRVRWKRWFTVVATFISGTMFAHPWPPSRTECTFTLCTLNGFLFSQSSAVTDMLSLSLRQTLRVSTFVFCFRALLLHICTDSHVSADLYASLKGQL